MVRRLFGVGLGFLAAVAYAGDRSREVEDLGDVRRFRYAIDDMAVSFELPIQAITRDLALSGAHPLKELVEARAQAVRIWAEARPAGERAVVTIDVQVDGAKLKFDVLSTGGPGSADAALVVAQQVSGEARASFLQTHGYEDADGLIRPAHARLVAEYPSVVKPIADALGKPLEEPEAFAARALSFVQAIPYERRSDAGDSYRRPLAILDGDRGDCDSKAVLYLALVKEAFPEVSAALFYIPGHLYVGLDLKGQGTRVDSGGHSYLVAEPAGPGMLPLGRLDDRHVGVGIVDARVVP